MAKGKEGDFIDAAHSILDRLGVPKEGEEPGGDKSGLAIRIERETKAWVEGKVDELMANVSTVYDFKKNPMVRDLIKSQLTKFAEECYAKGAQAAHRLAVIDE